MKTMSRTLAISLMITAFLTGAGTGYLLTPSYQTARSKGQAHGAYTDASYLKGLQGHHQQALDLARAGLASPREEVRTLSQAILSGMPGKIEELKTWRRDWFGDTSEPPVEPVNLGSVDQGFDLRWVNALDRHHREAIDMAKAALKASSRNEILTLSGEIIRIDTEDLAVFAGWRKAWYGL